MTVRVPFTGEEMEVAVSSPEEVREAAARAREAQSGWAERSPEERAEPFLRFHDLLLGRQDEILDLVQLETGKARKHAFEEVADTANVCRYYARRGPELVSSRRCRSAFPWVVDAREHRVPFGVVGIIAPWNYPLVLSVTDAVPALVAGNAVVLKPAERAADSARWAADLLVEAGLPDGLFKVVPGPGPELGPPLVEEVDFLGFTGSTEVGREVARRAAERLIPCSLELGGKNPMIVLADADLSRAVEGAVQGCFASAGQLCVSVERIYVEEPRFEEFAGRLAAAARGLRLGAGLDWEADMGSLVSEEQLEKVEAHVEDAVERGATLLTGGRRRPEVGPLFYEPTLLTGVRRPMRVHDEETFGPVAWIRPVADAEEAVERANDSRYGLNACVWTRDEERGREVACRVRAGVVNVNDAYAAAWSVTDAPVGGTGDSGLGRRHGPEGIRKYTESRTVAVSRGFSLSAPPTAGGKGWARALSAALRALRRLPGRS